LTSDSITPESGLNPLGRAYSQTRRTFGKAWRWVWSLK